MSFLRSVNAALSEALKDRKVVLMGQLVKYGLAGLTTGLHDRYQDRVITMPVAENLMHGAAFGMALAGMRPIVVNERMDFLALAMDPLVNHVPIWPARAPMSLPLVVMAVVGKGKGQGPQHSKNLTGWFRSLDGWAVAEPRSPREASEALLAAVFGHAPTMYVLHREFFGAEGEIDLPRPDRIGLCGASARHEREFYGEGN